MVRGLKTLAFQDTGSSFADNYYMSEPEFEERAARIADIPSAATKRKEFKPFTSTLSGALMLGLTIGWASLFVF
jgi:hypothetical protein